MTQNEIKGLNVGRAGSADCRAKALKSPPKAVTGSADNDLAQLLRLAGSFVGSKVMALPEKMYNRRILCQDRSALPGSRRFVPALMGQLSCVASLFHYLATLHAKPLLPLLKES